jgi:uncharacterized protein (DUF2147 family)
MKLLSCGGLASLALLASIPACGAEAGVSTASDPAGIWINPRNTVAVRAAHCGDRLCGWVVWLDPKAAQDARDAGAAHPLGTEVLRDYRPTGDGRWRGSVFVLDMGRSFGSSLEPAGPGLLKISGCLIGGFICRSQIWHRA